MSNGTMDKPKAEVTAPETTDAANPLDTWLKRELRALYGDAGHAELPDEIAELAARLEEKLGRADAGKRDGPRETGQAGSPPHRDREK